MPTRSKPVARVESAVKQPVRGKPRHRKSGADAVASQIAGVAAAKKKQKVEQKPEPVEQEAVEEHETSQMWILRHLRLFLEDVDDTLLVDFVRNQDVTPFRNFMMDFVHERRCVFILVLRQTAQLLTVPEASPSAFATAPASFLAKSPAETEATTLAVPPPASAESSPPKAKLMRPKKKKRRSPKKRGGEEKKETETDIAKREEAKKEIFADIDAAILAEPKIVLQWSNARKIPDESEEFVFVISRQEERLLEKSELDQSYYVGYCKSYAAFRRIIDIVTLVMPKRMSFERQIDLLLFGVHALAGKETMLREKWQNKTERFENFITDTLSDAYWAARTTERPRRDSVISLGDQRSTVESIESLLRPRLHVFVREPTASTRIQLLLEMSLYQLKFLKPSAPAAEISKTLSLTLTVLEVLDILYAAPRSVVNTDWLRRALYYTIELTARIVSGNLEECVAEVTADLFPRDQDGEDESKSPADPAVRVEVKPVFIRMLALALDRVFVTKNEEYSVLENIKQCLRIFEYIEEDLERVTKHVEFLRLPVHDMLVDRSPIDGAFVLLRDIWNVFQDTYFASALESGNIETMKTVCLQLSAVQEQLKATVTALQA